MTSWFLQDGRSRVVVLAASATGALLTLVTVGGFLGGRWWVTNLVSHLRVQYAIGFLVLAAVFVVVRMRPVAAICLVGVLANAAVVVPSYVDQPAPAARESDTLRIMFLNTKIQGADSEAVIEGLRTAPFDLVFLSSVTDRWAQAMEAAEIPFVVAQSRPRGTSLELLLLARRDVPVETTIRDFGPGGRGKAIEAMVALDGVPVRVLGVHPVSPITSGRAARNASLLEAVAAWARIQADPVVVVGDLNSTPWSPVFQGLLRDGWLVNSQSGFGIQASWPRILGPLGIPIDHALHSEELTTVDRTLGPGYGSSHNSLEVVFAFRDTG